MKLIYIPYPIYRKFPWFCGVVALSNLYLSSSLGVTALAVALLAYSVAIILMRLK